MVPEPQEALHREARVSAVSREERALLIALLSYFTLASQKGG